MKTVLLNEERKQRKDVRMRNNDFFRNSSDADLIKYFTSSIWGTVVPDDKYWADDLLEDRFILFFVYSFAHLNLPRPTRAQFEMALHVDNRDNPHRMLMCMRGLAKSLTSQIYVVWRLLNNPNEKILVMSASAARARNYTQFVQKLIHMLPISSNMTPRHNLERTSGQSFDVAGASPSDSPSVYAVGAGNQVTGMRASLVIYDDIETAQTVQSATVSEKINIYAMEAQNLLMSGKDESLTLCTPHSMSSIYVDWIARGHKPLIIPAEYPPIEQLGNYFGSIAPFLLERLEEDESLVGQAVDERMDIAFLHSKKMRIGKSAYKLQYMLDVSESDDLKHPLKLSDLIVMDVDDDIAPIKVSHSSMPDNIIKIKHNGFKTDKFYAPAFVSKEKLDYESKILSVDPAGRGKDEVGLAVIYFLNSYIYIKKVVGLQGGFEQENLEMIATLAEAYSVDTIVIEANWGGGSYLKMLEPYISNKAPNAAIDEISVKGQKEERICGILEPLLNQHKIIIDKATLDADSSAGIVFSFTHQLSKINRQRGSLRHDDRLDAVANGIIYMLDKIPGDDNFGIQRYNEQEEEEIRKLYDEFEFNTAFEYDEFVY